MMFGLFKNSTIHIVEAETAAMTMANMIQSMSSDEFISNAESIVREALMRTGINEELKDQEYREISQLAVLIKSGDRSAKTIRATLKSFKK